MKDKPMTPIEIENSIAALDRQLANFAYAMTENDVRRVASVRRKLVRALADAWEVVALRTDLEPEW